MAGAERATSGFDACNHWGAWKIKRTWFRRWPYRKCLLCGKREYAGGR